MITSPSGHISQSYGLAHNLHAAAEHHKRTCDENCRVSLSQLHNAADLLMKRAQPWPDGPNDAERTDFRTWIWPF